MILKLSYIVKLISVNVLHCNTRNENSYCNSLSPLCSDSTVISGSPGAKNMPLPPIPTNGTTEPKRVQPPRQPREKKIYVAAYDYKPCEEGDLELITVSFLKCTWPALV